MAMMTASLQPTALAPTKAGDLAVLDAARGLYVLDHLTGSRHTVVGNFGIYRALDMTITSNGNQEEYFVSLYRGGSEMLAVVRGYTFDGKVTGEWITRQSIVAGIGIDGSTRRAYLADARTPQILTLDLTRSGTSPKTFASVRGAESLGPLVFDPTQQQVIVGDVAGGRVFAVTTTTGATVLLADKIGEPSALALDVTGNRVLVADAAGHRIFALALKPLKSVLFAALPAFREPRALAIGAGGTIWVGDIRAQRLFQLTPTGAPLQTLAPR